MTNNVSAVFQNQQQTDQRHGSEVAHKPPAPAPGTSSGDVAANSSSPQYNPRRTTSGVLPDLLPPQTPPRSGAGENGSGRGGVERESQRHLADKTTSDEVRVNDLLYYL